MTRSYTLASSSAAFFLAFGTSSDAQSIRTGQQCVPAVADASLYHNCRLRIVQGQETCRCAIRPQAQRRMDRPADSDLDDTVTGSLGNGPAAGPGIGNPASGTSGAIGSGTPATNNIGGNASPERAGAVADTNTAGRSASGTNSTGSSRSGGNAGGPSGSADNGGTGTIGGTGSAGGGVNAGNGNGGGRGNNGHGNDDDGNDSSNPGRSNNGDGTDQDGPAGNGGGNGNGDSNGNGGGKR